jgi:hypothetical protein
MTLYQQNVHNFSAIKTGLALLPMVITMMVLSPISGAFINRIGPRRMISAGMIVTGLGTLLSLRSGVDASYLDIVPAFVVMGIGMSGIWAPMTTAVLNSVESEKSGVASAVNGALREIGTAFGVALLGTLAPERSCHGVDQLLAIRRPGGATRSGGHLRDEHFAEVIRVGRLDLAQDGSALRSCAAGEKYEGEARQRQPAREGQRLPRR